MITSRLCGNDYVNIAIIYKYTHIIYEHKIFAYIQFLYTSFLYML